MSQDTTSEFTPLVLSPSGPATDLHPLHIVPDSNRQRRRLMRRGLAVVATMAIVCLFAVALWLLGERDGGLSLLALAIGSGLLSMVALGGWTNFAVRRARKRARRHEWRMSVS